MYRAGIEGIIGLVRRGNSIRISPCIPATWPGFELTVNIGNTRYHIEIKNMELTLDPQLGLTIDGETATVNSPFFINSETIELPVDEKTHQVVWSMVQQARFAKS